MAFFYYYIPKIAKKLPKRKVTKNSSLSVIIDQEIPKKYKNCLYFNYFFILRNIAIKLAADEVTKLWAILMKI